MTIPTYVFPFGILSAVAFGAFGLDKWKARHHQWRISEGMLIGLSLLGGMGGLMGMLIFHHKTRKWKFRIWVPLFAVLQMIAFFLCWSGDFNHAGPMAFEALASDDTVQVETLDNGWLLDGPSEDTALIFYPGAKVQEVAYAPLLRQLAEETMDVYLVKMPLRLAILDPDRADGIIQNTSYEHYYIGGHSLGGAMAADYAAGHGDRLDGVILLAAYPTKQLRDVREILIYGSEDRVLDQERLAAGEAYAPEAFVQHVIQGGNHTGFGDCHAQKGDGTATISPQAQWDETVSVICQAVN